MAACTTPQPRPHPLTEVKVAAPAECTLAHFQTYVTHLSRLPAGFVVLVPEEQARAILKNKADDALLYGTLLANAERCAPRS